MTVIVTVIVVLALKKLHVQGRRAGAADGSGALAHGAGTGDQPVPGLLAGLVVVGLAGARWAHLDWTALPPLAAAALAYRRAYRIWSAS